MSVPPVGPANSSDDQVVLGVDTHKDVHVAVVLSVLGVLLAAREFPTTRTGYRDMLTWVRSYGPLRRAGVEGTGSYGAALTRLCARRACTSSRSTGRTGRRGADAAKSDVVNAEAAARAVLAEDATAVPKRADGPVEAMRILKTAKDSAVKARVQAINQLKAVLVSADPALREALNPLCTGQLTARCAELTTRAEDSCHDDVTAATVHTLGHLARRIQYLQAEIHDLQQRIAAAVESAAPRLLEVGGIAPGRGGHAPDRGR